MLAERDGRRLRGFRRLEGAGVFRGWGQIPADWDGIGPRQQIVGALLRFAYGGKTAGLEGALIPNRRRRVQAFLGFRFGFGNSGMIRFMNSSKSGTVKAVSPCCGL